MGITYILSCKGLAENNERQEIVRELYQAGRHYRKKPSVMVDLESSVK